jgi:hypothetical protein
VWAEGGEYAHYFGLTLGYNAHIGALTGYIIGSEHSIRQEGVGVFVAVSLLARPEMAVLVY